MSKVLVLYYSSYGHIEAMAAAVAEGAREAGAQVDIKRVPELVSDKVARDSHYKVDQAAPVAKIDDLAAYDAIIIGTGTRFGRLTSQMANFLDQAGGLWMRGALHGKVGGAFTSTATQHGGQETTLFSIITNLLHFGMVVVGLDYGHAGQMTLNEITGGSPYGATTITGGDGSRRPSANELVGARYQGRKIAEVANKLHGWCRALAPAWTILRMNFYAEAFVQLAQASLNQGVLTGLAENRAAFVARGDVAAAAAGILIGDGHPGWLCRAQSISKGDG